MRETTCASAPMPAQRTPIVTPYCPPGVGPKAKSRAIPNHIEAVESDRPRRLRAIDNQVDGTAKRSQYLKMISAIAAIPEVLLRDAYRAA